MTHPFLTTDTPFPAAKFNQMNPDAVDAALSICLKDIEENLSSLRDDRAPTFQNTFVPFDTLFLDLRQLRFMVDMYMQTTGDPALEETKKLLEEKILDIENVVYQDDIISARIAEVYAQRDHLPLDTEDLYFMQNVYDKFAKKGAFLNINDKARLSEIDFILNDITEKFSQNTTQSTPHCALLITDIDELKGLSPDTLDAMRAQAQKAGHAQGWLVIPDRLMIANNYLVFAEDSNFRKNIFDAGRKIGSIEGHDNTQIVADILRLREEKAQLLGYKNYSELALKNTMAKTPEAVDAFLKDIASKAFPEYARQVGEFQKLARQNGFEGDLQPWDIPYWAKKYRENKFPGVDTNISPFLELNNTIDGFFVHIEKMLNLSFTQSDSYPVYHPDVRVYEIMDKSKGEICGLLYADFFARPGEKRSGAWMEGMILKTDDQIPASFIAMNFQKPVGDRPALLKPPECRTFYHEGGHSKHHIVGNQCKYKSMQGVISSSDYVEFPSQIMENYFFDVENLRTLRHYETGEALSEQQIAMIVEEGRFNKLSAVMSITKNGFIDLMAHSLPADMTTDRDQLLSLARFGIEGEDLIAPASLNAFSHLFYEPDSMYASQYYSYGWSQMLDADAFKMLKEVGIYNTQVTSPLKAAFAKGGGVDPVEIFRDFAGRNPTTDAMLERVGIQIARPA